MFVDRTTQAHVHNVIIDNLKLGYFDLLHAITLEERPRDIYEKALNGNSNCIPWISSRV